MKPIDRFAMDIARIRFLPPDPVSEELFYAEDSRKVKKDNTFPFRTKRYQAPADLRDKQIAIRFDRARPTRVVVYYKDERIGEATELDLVANAHLKRGKGGSR